MARRRDAPKACAATPRLCAQKWLQSQSAARTSRQSGWRAVDDCRWKRTAKQQSQSIRNQFPRVNIWTAGPARSGDCENLGPPLEIPAAQSPLPASRTFDGDAWINAYRATNNMPDLFGRPSWPNDKGTVAVTEIDGKLYFGVNSGAPGYTIADQKEADHWRGTLVDKYPDELQTKNIGRVPNDSFYHAEATVLLRAAMENNGTLQGRTFDIHTDREVCASSCLKVLPKLGLELGNPRVTFIAPDGLKRTMWNGRWE
jgi:hypothetical protein